MNTFFRLVYQPHEKGLYRATLQSPEMDNIENIFGLGDYVHLMGLKVGVDFMYTDHEVPGNLRCVYVKTRFPGVLMALEQKGWVFTDGRETVVADKQKIEQEVERDQASARSRR